MKIEELYDIFVQGNGVSTDTRQIKAGSIFFALKGDRFNANAFAEEAINKGARFAVIDEATFRKDERFIVVPDSLVALQDLARFHRSKLTIPVVGLTGSNGKTTSKELLSAVLATKYKTYATKGNLNNHIGVPLTLLAIDNSYEIAVVEMGANHLGEIALLCSIAQPTHGFITNIGKAHIGTFGGFDNIVRAKSEIFQYLLETGGAAFINSLNPILQNMSRRFANPLTYPSHGDYYHCELISADPYVRFRAENGEEVQTHLIGSYNFENIAAALCIGKHFNVDPGKANQAVGSYQPGNMRSQVVNKNSNIIILDAYNANPSSMKVAIENLASMNAERKVLILGDMYELEDETEKEHRDLGQLIQQLGFNEVYLCGKHMKVAQLEIPSARHFETKEDLTKVLAQNPFRNATVLIKASRGIGLETIVDYI